MLTRTCACACTRTPQASTCSRAASITYGYSLFHMRSQPLSPTVTASLSYGCSLHHVRLQASTCSRAASRARAGRSAPSRRRCCSPTSWWPPSRASVTLPLLALALALALTSARTLTLTLTLAPALTLTLAAALARYSGHLSVRRSATDSLRVRVRALACVGALGRRATAFISYGSSLHSTYTYGCSLSHIRLQPLSHTVAASRTYGCRRGGGRRHGLGTRAARWLELRGARTQP